MGWSLKIQETKKYGKRYKFWTSVSEGWINEDWLTRDEVIKFLFWYRFEKMADSFIEDAVSFPNGWSAKGEMRRLPYDEGLADALHDWRVSTFDAEDYYGAIFDKFSEMLDKHGINLNVHDGEEVFSNTEHKIKDYSAESLNRKNKKSFKEVEEIAKEFGLDYNQAVDLWSKMNKKFIADRNPLNPLNFLENE